jgi:hypothetical protein
VLTQLHRDYLAMPELYGVPDMATDFATDRPNFK